MLHFHRKSFNDSIYQSTCDMLKLLPMLDLDGYYKTLSRTELINEMRRASNLRHGEHKRLPDIHGEVDFITDETIYDVKVYSSRSPDNYGKWFAQLYLYRELFGDHRLCVIDIMGNKLITFKPTAP